MKKSTMIFLSAILAVMILFIPNSKVNATYTNTFNVNENDSVMSFLENSTLYFDRLDEVISGLQYLTADYDIFIFTGSSSNYNTNVYLLQKYDSVDYGHFYYKIDTQIWFQTYARNPNGLTTRFYSTSFQLKVSDFSASSVIDSIEQHISNSSNVRTNKNQTHDIWRGIASNNSMLYYSSADIIYGTNGYTTTNNYEKLSYTYNNTSITNGSKYVDYYNYWNGYDINLTKGLSCDLEGNDVYNIRVDFERGFNVNNKFQIKTDYTDWIDITNYILEAYEYGYYHYDYTLKYNSKVYARILDANNNVLATNEIEITDLSEYVKISHSIGCDLNNRDINIIDFDLINAYNENYIYQYSYDNKKFYNMAVDANNLKYSLNHAINIPIYFRILDPNSNVVYEQYYNPNFEDLDKDVLIFETTDIINNEKQIKIHVDFTEYLDYFDMYNYTIYVDNVKYDESTFFLDFISTKDNFIKSINIQIYVDDLLIENIGYRCGSFGGGGSDIDNFDDMYENVLENELNNELLENNYDSANNMVKSAQKFIESIANIVTTFFDLIMTFFNRLNIWIRVCIINLFVVLVICKTIKAVRK